MKWLAPAALIALLVGSWELIAKLGHVENYLLPAPSEVASALWAEPVAKVRFRVLADVLLYAVPVALIIADFLARRANRQHSTERLDLG